MDNASVIYVVCVALIPIIAAILSYFLYKPSKYYYRHTGLLIYKINIKTKEQKLCHFTKYHRNLRSSKSSLSCFRK